MLIDSESLKNEVQAASRRWRERADDAGIFQLDRTACLSQAAGLQQAALLILRAEETQTTEGTHDARP